jgi:hypothetical protein
MPNGRSEEARCMGEAGGSRPGLSRVVRREIAAEADAREKEGGGRLLVEDGWRLSPTISL